MNCRNIDGKHECVNDALQVYGGGLIFGIFLSLKKQDSTGVLMYWTNFRKESKMTLRFLRCGFKQDSNGTNIPKNIICVVTGADDENLSLIRV